MGTSVNCSGVSDRGHGSDELPFFIIATEGGASLAASARLWEDLSQAARYAANPSHSPQLIIRSH